MTTIWKVIEGLTILAKYSNGDVCAEHDEIFAGHGEDCVVSDADKATLEELGWFFSKSSGSWKKFV